MDGPQGHIDNWISGSLIKCLRLVALCPMHSLPKGRWTFKKAMKRYSTVQ